jgi:hypothetical protein
MHIDCIDTQLDAMRMPFEKPSSLAGGEPSSVILACAKVAGRARRTLCLAGQAPRRTKIIFFTQGFVIGIKLKGVCQLIDRLIKCHCPLLILALFNPLL